MSYRRSFAVTLTAALAAILAGCGDKTPSCADPATVSLVQQIYQQSFDKEHGSMSPERQRRVQFTSNDTKVTVEAITLASTDEATGKKTCSAVLTTVMPQDAIPSDQRMLNHLRGTYEPQGAGLDGNTVKGNVTYTVQRTEDSKDVLVKLTGHLPFMGLFHDLAMLRVFDKSDAEFDQMAGTAPKAVEAKTADSPQPEPVPVSQQAPSVAPPVASVAAQVVQPAAAQAPAAVAAAAPTVNVPHLCTGSETPVFACSTGKKRASICSSHGGTVEQLVYRIAPLEGTPEMEYPNAGAAAGAAFQYGAQTTSDGKPIPFLSFDKGNYRYVIYAGGVQRQGIVVEQQGKRIADLRCQSDAMAAFDPAAWQRMRIAQDGRGLQLP